VPVRSIWFGMRCAFTQAALEGALETGGVLAPVAIVLPRGPKPAGPGWPEPRFDRWLRERGVAVIEAGGLSGRDLAAVEGVAQTHDIALGVGACFPWKIPAALRALLPCGVVNIHPSLLPVLRGPEPVFHAFRLGLAETGVTVHLMDEGWDSGPVIAQERVAIPAGDRAESFEAALAHRGGLMLAGIASRWCEGTITALPQDPSGASWAPVPDRADLHLSETLTVDQARRFVVACGPLTATDADSGRRVDVDGIATSETGAPPGQPVIRVRCRNGDLWLRQVTARDIAETPLPFDKGA
jgi:methionyl-tRNA formyltransferase